MDRVGDSGTVNKKARRELSRLALRFAAQRSITFYGWCTCRVEILRHKSYVIIATPDKSDEDEQYWNHYHADLSRAEHRDKRRAYELATALAQYFQL